MTDSSKQSERFTNMNKRTLMPLVLAVACILTLAAASYAQPQNAPFSKVRLMKLLLLDTSPQEVIQAVSQKGVDFKPSPQDLTKTITGQDTPSAGIPAVLSAPANVITTLDYEFLLALYVACEDEDATGHHSGIFTTEAAAEWRFNATGDFQWQFNAAGQPGKEQWLPKQGVAGIAAPTQWTKDRGTLHPVIDGTIQNLVSIDFDLK